MPALTAHAINSGLVTKLSSPTNWTRSPSVAVSSASRSVGLAEAILDAPDGELVDHLRVAIDHVLARQRLATNGVPAVTVKFAGGRIEGDRDAVAPGGVTGVANGVHDQLQNLFWQGDIGREATLIAQPCLEATFRQYRTQPLIDFGAGTDARVATALRSARS